MRLSIKANPNSQKLRVFYKAETLYVYFKAKREGGEANERLIEILSEFLSIPKSALKILTGKTGTRKSVEITFSDLEKVRARLAAVEEK